MVAQNLLSGPPGGLPPPANQNQSMEQQALQGGGVNNKQQVSNFMNALNQSGAGVNNSFMNGAPPQAGAFNPIMPQQAQMPNVQNTPNTIQQNTMSQAPTNMSATNTPGYYSGGGGGGVAGNQAFQPSSVTPQGTTTTPAGTFDPNGYVSYAANVGQGSPTYVPNAPVYSAGTGQGSTTYNPSAPVYSAAPPPLVVPSTSFVPSAPVPALTPTNSSPTPAPGTTATAPVTSPYYYPSAPVSSTGSGSTSTTLGGAYSQYSVSDENLKENITPGDDKLHEFMSTIKAHNYEYKDKSDGEGQFTTPMAQELQKTELGKQAVIETPRGLMVDYARLGGVNLAAVAVVHKEQTIMQREQAKLQRQVDQLRKALKGTK